MAITAYTGPPGAGKSHALVKDVILRAVLAGRRVVANVDGLNPNAILGYCLEREKDWLVDHADKLGEVVTFHGEDSKQPGFWPTEESEKNGIASFVKPGDLVVFDEWAMFYPTGEKGEASKQVELFMRWHRHLTDPVHGHATDLAIATQSITDLSRQHRPLLSRSYLFKKLTAVGASGRYTWHAYDGRLQRTPFQTGTGAYDPKVFPLYASSSAAASGNHTELKTNTKESIWGGWKAKAFVGLLFVLLIGGSWGLNSAWASYSEPASGASGAAVDAAGNPVGVAPGGVPAAPPPPPPSPWRIVGQVEGEQGTRVIVADDKGAVRMMKPDGFDVDEGRPVSGMVDGRTAHAEERLPASGGLPSMSQAFGQ